MDNADNLNEALEETPDKGVLSKKNAHQVAYSKGEEKANIITHLCGACLGLLAAVLLIVRVSFANLGALAVVAVCLYAFCLIELYVMSTLYHAQPFGSTRRTVFRKFDHCSVAMLIAGTYAPYTLIGLSILGKAQNPDNFIWGIVIASVVLAMAVLVIIFNAINVHKFRVFSLISYVVMGWACVIRIPALFTAIGLPAFIFLIAGGVAYTVGILFYRIKRIPWNHAIWHFFVLAGSILHFVSIYFFMLNMPL